MKRCGRAIVVKDGRLLVMKRYKLGKSYFCLLGGGVNPGENEAAAAIREVKEESGVVVANPRHVYTEDAGDPFGVQFIFCCDYVSGEPKLPADSEEAFWAMPGKNTYEPLWLDFQELDNVPFVSPRLKSYLIDARDNGFPAQAVHFSSKHDHDRPN